MKRIAISVIAILPAISLYSLWLLVSSHDTEDIYFSKGAFSMDNEEHIEHLDAIPVGSVIYFDFLEHNDRDYIIATHCKLDTVTIWNDNHFLGVVCEVEKKRERKNFYDSHQEYGE